MLTTTAATAEKAKHDFVDLMTMSSTMKGTEETAPVKLSSKPDKLTLLQLPKAPGAFMSASADHQKNALAAFATPTVKSVIQPITTLKDLQNCMSTTGRIRHIHCNVDAKAYEEVLANAYSISALGDVAWDPFTNPLNFDGLSTLTFENVAQVTDAKLDVRTSPKYNNKITTNALTEGLTLIDSAVCAQILSVSLISPNPTWSPSSSDEFAQMFANSEVAYVSVSCAMAACSMLNIDYSNFEHTITTSATLPIPDKVNPLRIVTSPGYLAIRVKKSTNYPGPLSLPVELIGKQITLGQTVLDDSTFWSVRQNTVRYGSIVARGLMASAASMWTIDKGIDLNARGLKPIPVQLLPPGRQPAELIGFQMTEAALLSDPAFGHRAFISNGCLGMVISSKNSSKCAMLDLECKAYKINPSMFHKHVMSLNPSLALSPHSIHDRLLEAFCSTRCCEVSVSLLVSLLAMACDGSLRSCIKTLQFIWSNGNWSDYHLSAIAAFYQYWCSSAAARISSTLRSASETQKSASKEYFNKLAAVGEILKTLKADDGSYVFPNGGASLANPLNLIATVQTINLDVERSQPQMRGAIKVESLTLKGWVRSLSGVLFGGFYKPVVVMSLEPSFVPDMTKTIFTNFSSDYSRIYKVFSKNPGVTYPLNPVFSSSYVVEGKVIRVNSTRGKTNYESAVAGFKGWTFSDFWYLSTYILGKKEGETIQEVNCIHTSTIELADQTISGDILAKFGSSLNADELAKREEKVKERKGKALISYKIPRAAPPKPQHEIAKLE